MSDFATQLDSIAERILAELEAAGQAKTAWELKLRLKIPLSELYLALGRLERDGCIHIAPEGLSYRVQPRQSQDAASASVTLEPRPVTL